MNVEEVHKHRCRTQDVRISAFPSALCCIKIQSSPISPGLSTNHTSLGDIRCIVMNIHINVYYATNLMLQILRHFPKFHIKSPGHFRGSTGILHLPLQQCKGTTYAGRPLRNSQSGCSSESGPVILVQHIKSPVGKSIEHYVHIEWCTITKFQ